tara:strand:- start:28 stop:459 length:432 start_codon:yes stop_codon:yes gene_type:complete
MDRYSYLFKPTPYSPLEEALEKITTTHDRARPVGTVRNSGYIILKEHDNGEKCILFPSITRWDLGNDMGLPLYFGTIGEGEISDIKENAEIIIPSMINVVTELTNELKRHHIEYVGFAMWESKSLERGQDRVAIERMLKTIPK